MKFPLIFLISSLIKSQTYTKESFVQQTMSMILSKKNSNIEYDKQIQILRIIYDEMKSNVNTRLLLFMSVVLHKTSFLTIFEDTEDTQKYKSRGLLFLKGEILYRDLSRYSKMYDYVNYPEVLSSLKGTVIKDNIDFFDRLLFPNYTLDHYLMCFNNNLVYFNDYLEDEEEIKDIYDSLKQRFPGII